MRLSLKFLVWMWGVLFLILGGLVFNAYNKIKPEAFIASLNEQLSKNAPGARLTVGSTNYRLSVDFNLILNDLKLLKDNLEIGTLGEMELRVPWWLLLFDQGNAQINLKDLEIWVAEDSTSERGAVSVSPNMEEKVDLSFDLPTYLTQAQFTLRAKNVVIKNSTGERRYLTLSKLLVREFQIGKNSAFEINIPVHIQHNSIDHNSELWLFGDITPGNQDWSVNFRGEFKSKEGNERYQLDDLIIEAKAKFNTQGLENSAELIFINDRETIGRGTLRSAGEVITLQADFSKLPLSYLQLFESELKNEFMPSLVGEAEGSLRVSKNLKSGLLSLSSVLSFPGAFHFPESGSSLEGQWKLSAENTRWEASFITAKGEVSFFRRSIINLEKGKVQQYIEEIGFTDVDLALALATLKPLPKLLESSTPFFTTTLSIKNNTHHSMLFDGNFRFGIMPDQTFYTGEIKSEKSELKFDFLSKQNIKKISLMAKEFPVSSNFNLFFPIYFASQGSLHGSVEGKWEGKWQDGAWQMKLKALGAEKQDGLWTEYLQEIWAVFNLETTQLPDQVWSGNLNNSVLQVDSLMLEGSDPASITGLVDLNGKKKSFLTLTYPNNKKWKPVRKEPSDLFWKRE
jgi:hypothetical protein